MSVLTDPPTYPISAAAARQLDRPLFGHVIDGEVVPSLEGGTMPVIDPATGAQVATAAAGSAADVERAVRSARAAFDDGRWRYLPPLEQERRLRRLAALIAEHGDELAELDVIDSGLLRFYAGFIVQFAVDGIDYYSGWPSKLHGSIPAVPREFAVYQVREPLGVVGAIMPWNGPTAAAAMSLFALVRRQQRRAQAGRADADDGASASPSSRSRRGSRRACSTSSRAPARRSARPSSPIPRSTRSRSRARTPTGRAIQAAAAARVKRVSLELGGKSPSIIFPDADLEAASAAAMAGVWGASGQVCTCGTRVLVHESVHDEVVGRIVEQSRGIRIGGGFDPDAEMGPVVSAEQLERIQRYVRHRPGRGRRAGARRIAPRRSRLLPRADRLHRRAQRDEDRPGGDLRARDVAC